VPHVAVAAPSLGRADAKVDLCHSADEAGPGTNLQRALTRPLNPNNATNNIIFECGGSATITVDRPLEIFQATAVDGANAVTLTDTNPSFRSSIFVVGSSTTFLFLRNLTLTHPNTQRQVFCGTSTCIGTVINAQGTTELDNVVIENSDTPVSATSGSLTVSQSRFTGNSGRLIVAGPGVTSTIVNSVFQNNPDTAPILASGTVNISGSPFVNNNSPLFFPGLCQLNVDNSTFQNNTDAALFINCSSVTISNSLFASNSASIFGAAIRFAASAQQICTPGDSRHVGFRQLFDV
jgi:Right handed beta helix region